MSTEDYNDDKNIDLYDKQMTISWRQQRIVKGKSNTVGKDFYTSRWQSTKPS